MSKTKKRFSHKIVFRNGSEVYLFETLAKARAAAAGFPDDCEIRRLSDGRKVAKAAR